MKIVFVMDFLDGFSVYAIFNGIYICAIKSEITVNTPVRYGEKWKKFYSFGNVLIFNSNWFERLYEEIVMFRW